MAHPKQQIWEVEYVEQLMWCTTFPVCAFVKDRELLLYAMARYWPLERAQLDSDIVENE